MKKQYSLKGKKSFREVLTKGKRYNRNGIQFIIKNGTESGDSFTGRNNNLVYYKIGIIVNRQFGKANIRNKARRKIKAILLDFLPFIEKDKYIIVRLFKQINLLNFQELKEEVSQILKEANILKKDFA